MINCVKKRLALCPNVDLGHALYGAFQAPFVLHHLGLDPESHQVCLKTRLSEDLFVRTLLRR